MIDKELERMLEQGFTEVARQIIREEFPETLDHFTDTAQILGILLRSEVPLSSPIRVSVLSFLGFMESATGIPDICLPDLNVFLLDSLKSGNTLIEEKTARFLSEHDTYFAYPRNTEPASIALLAAVRDVVRRMPEELRFYYVEAFGFRQ